MEDDKMKQSKDRKKQYHRCESCRRYNKMVVGKDSEGTELYIDGCGGSWGNTPQSKGEYCSTYEEA
jgi:hypothetical protein